MWVRSFLLIAGVVLARPLWAEDVQIDAPLAEAPFNFLHHGYMGPSMRQSLAVATDFSQIAHVALAGPQPEQQSWRLLLVGGFDVLGDFLPFGSAWAHEEWHRAVMSRRGISSYDDIYNIPIGADVIAVSHVTDEDLINLKAEHPHELVRLSSAGMEAQVEQNWQVARTHFFNRARSRDLIMIAMNDLSVGGYLFTCASDKGDELTDRMNVADGADVSKRDFTGLDCTAWVYDLFRPDEPYTARGIHPSGVGVNRYIKYSELTSEERRFLRLQSYLSVLNLADPFLIERDSFHSKIFGREVDWNARLSHELTSFGYTVDAGLFMRSMGREFLFRLHNGFNDAGYFPGLTAEWWNAGLGARWSVNSHFTLWSQPRGQAVDTRASSQLLAGGVELDYRWAPDWSPYLGVEAKTPGWLPGNVFLDRDATVWAGFRAGVPVF